MEIVICVFCLCLDITMLPILRKEGSRWLGGAGREFQWWKNLVLLAFTQPNYKSCKLYPLQKYSKWMSPSPPKGEKHFVSI